MTNPVIIKRTMVKVVTSLCFVLAMGVFGCQEQVQSNSIVTSEGGNSPTNPIQANSTSLVPDATTPLDKSQKDSTIIVYYFHRTTRCFTCRVIETNAGRVIQEHFSRQIADGSLIWIPVNLDEPVGKDLETEFNISMNTLLVAKMNGVHPTEYKKLDKVWQLVNNPEEFSKYVVKEINDYLI